MHRALADLRHLRPVRQYFLVQSCQMPTIRVRNKVRIAILCVSAQRERMRRRATLYVDSITLSEMIVRCIRVVLS